MRRATQLPQAGSIRSCDFTTTLPAWIVENDDYNPPYDRDSMINWSTSGMPTQLPADSYQLNLIAYNGQYTGLNGRDGHWAVDLTADAAKFTLTGVDKINNTGATTVTSLSMGSDDVPHRQSCSLVCSRACRCSAHCSWADTGAAEVTVTTGSLTSGNGDLDYLGFEPGSVGSVTLRQGGSWVSNANFVQLGWQGEGNLTVESGGWAFFNGLLALAEYPGSEGNLTVTGLDSIVTTNSNLIVGEGGEGYMRIADRGKVYSTGQFFYEGDTLGWSSGRGTVEVDGKDSQWSSGTLIVGNSGQGTVGITNGGKIATTGNAYIGKNPDGHDSTVTLSGAAPDGTLSTWAVSGNLFIAGDGLATWYATNSKLTINPGALVDVAGTTTVWDTVWNPGGSLEILGGELETGSFVVTPGATFTHEDGTLTVNGGTFDPGTGTGNYVITGADSADRPKVVLTNGADSVPLGWLIVGQDSYGELTIENGATLSATNVGNSFAPAAPASGKIIVQGSGSQLVVTSPAMSHHSLMIGANGPGELTVSAGGQVYVQSGGASLACCFNYAGRGTGVITIEGSDSLLEAMYVDFRAVGGDSSVTIRDHGVVRTTHSDYVSSIAPVPHSTPTTVSVDITNGGRLEIAGQLDIGGSGGDTNVSLDGASAGQAALTVNGPLNVGYSTNFGLGTTRLTVINDGLVSADSVKVWQPGTVELNNGIVSTGNLELAGGTLLGKGVVLVGGQLTNAGVIAPGMSAGVITVSEGNYFQTAAGKLAIEIGGTSPFAFDRLNIVNGSATLSARSPCH